jgi:hypothetical protein
MLTRVVMVTLVESPSGPELELNPFKVLIWTSIYFELSKLQPLLKQPQQLSWPRPMKKS